MFDFIRNLTKSAEEKQQEALNAYLDDALSPRQQAQFEQDLANDADLQAQVDGLRSFKQQMRQMPQRRVRRNFTLDPNVYGTPAKQPLFQFYPVLQGATVLTAFFFIVAVALEIFMMPNGAPMTASAPTDAESSVAIVQESEMDAADDVALGEAEPMDSAANEEMAEIVEMEEESIAEAELMMEDAASADSDEGANDGETMESESPEPMAIEAEPLMEEAPAEEEAEADSESAGTSAVTEEDASMTDDEEMQDEAESALPAPSSTSSGSPRVTETETAVPDDRAVPTVTPMPTETAVPTQDLSASLTEEAQSQASRQEFPTPTSVSSTNDVPVSSSTALRIAQIAFAALLIIFGAMTYWVRRRS